RVRPAVCASGDVVSPLASLRAAPSKRVVRRIGNCVHNFILFCADFKVERACKRESVPLVENDRKVVRFFLLATILPSLTEVVHHVEESSCVVVYILRLDGPPVMWLHDDVYPDRRWRCRLGRGRRRVRHVRTPSS